MMQQIWRWVHSKKITPWAVYSGLALLVLLPLLLPGYVVTLDLVFTPHFSWPSELTNTYLFDALLWLVLFIVPGDIIEKIILFFILLLSGVGMYRLLEPLRPKDLSAELWRFAPYFAGVFYMINPFTYSRFMAGQWLVLAGYALLPFFFAALLKLAASPTWRSSVNVSLWGFAIVTLSIHHAGMLLLLGVLVVGTNIRRAKNKSLLFRLLGFMSVSVLIVALLSSYWLIPALLGKGEIGRAVSDFTTVDFLAFATTAHGPLGALGEVIRLQGFWTEVRGLYLLPQAVVPLWGVLFVLIWTMVVIGGVKLWRYSHSWALLTYLIIGLGVILAATPFIAWLSQFLPALSGYREPHKFINLTVLGYAMLGGIGSAYVIRWALRRYGEAGSQISAVICLFLPLVITPVMLWGFAGQLSPRHYPQEWYEVNGTLKRINGRGAVLVLPWHQYMKYEFSGRIIANPAEKFFEVPVIASNDPEFKQVSPTVPDAKKQAITKALRER
ncbi:MAG TPA: hypothetical protein VFT59_00600, partial [Candidatus Saccharimonadales bacterium]|nr:hypothetical protein [Candidatus Saccharimonadales bacterium]